MMIERAMNNLHSIYLTRGMSYATAVPEPIEINIRSFQTTYPEWKHNLFGNEVAVEFLERHFDKDTLNSFRAIVPLAYKADLLRYCVLYHLGGIYSDLSLVHLAPFLRPDDSSECVFFRDALNGPTIISNSLIYARSKSPIFEAAINQINDNVKNREYGSNDLCPTGPIMLGRLVATKFRPNVMRCGDVRSVANTGGSTHLYYDEAGRLIAVKHKVSQGLAALGGEHDAYGDHFKSRRVYGEPKLYVQASAGTDFEPWKIAGCTIADGLLNFVGDGSYPLYGPYVNIGPGKYKISGKFASIDGSGSLLMNLSAGAGRYDIATQKIESLDFGYYIDIPCRLDDFEVRLVTQECRHFSLATLRLEEL